MECFSHSRSFAGDGLTSFQREVGGLPLSSWHRRRAQRRTSATIVTVLCLATCRMAHSGQPSKQPDREKLAEIHPALRTEDSFPFHRFGREIEFARWKSGILFGMDFAKSNLSDEFFEVSALVPFPSLGANGRRDINGVPVQLILSQRNPPTLFGAGLIDRIPDRVLEEVAAEQARAAEIALKAKGGRKQEPECSLFDPQMGQSTLPLAGRVAPQRRRRLEKPVATPERVYLRRSTELGLEVRSRAPPWKKDCRLIRPSPNNGSIDLGS